MENENNKNYYKIVSSKIQIKEEMNDENLKKQWEDDINFAKEELREEIYNKNLEKCYYNVFIDRFLVRTIETIIRNTNCKKDLGNTYSICLYFDRYSCSENFAICCATIYVPNISVDALASVEWDSSMARIDITGRIFLYHFDNFFDKMYKNISFYTVVATDTTSQPSDEKNEVDDCESNLSKVLSFECTLKELLNMYYMEKQRQEYENLKIEIKPNKNTENMKQKKKTKQK